VATFTPPTALSQSASMSPTELVDESHGIYETALPLNHTALFQLNGLLQARAQSFADSRRNQLLACAGVAAAYLVALLAVVMRRRRKPVPSGADQPVSPAPAPPAGEPGREAVLAGRTPPNSRGAT
jgi:hypothetical protein